MTESKERKGKEIFYSLLLLALTIFILVTALILCLYGLYGLSALNHNMNMEILNTEKEISLINNNISLNNNNNQDERFYKITDMYLDAKEETQKLSYNYALCYEGIYPHRKEFNK